VNNGIVAQNYTMTPQNLAEACCWSAVQ